MATPNKIVAIYARVSTDKQKVDMQLRDYVTRSDWTILDEFIDQAATGGNTKNPAFQAMLASARQKKFQILLVWKLDRLSRSLKDLINTLDELGSLGIDFVSYDNHLDTWTPTGKLVFQSVGAVWSKFCGDPHAHLYISRQVLPRMGHNPRTFMPSSVGKERDSLNKSGAYLFTTSLS